MRTKHLLLAFLALMGMTTTAQAQVAINETNFPDNNFRQYVADHIDTDLNGTLSVTELKVVRVLSVTYKDIADLTGIEHFPNLRELYCNNNVLTSLDVSKNASLKTLSCGYNQLTSLDVSKNTSLKTLSCGYNQLTSLDVSKNVDLEWFGCDINEISSLDFSNNTNLHYLRCGLNQLTSIVLPESSELEVLSLYGNQLTSLDISKVSESLSELECDGNQLASLDLSECSRLTFVGCSGNQLTSLLLPQDASGLYEVYCFSNQLKGEAMDALIGSLPAEHESTEIPILYVISTADESEGNVCTVEHVAAAKEKGWQVREYVSWDWDEENWLYGGPEYEGSPVPSAIGLAADGLRTTGVWHTLGGVRLQGAPTKRGVYLCDGKRVVVK